MSPALPPSLEARARLARLTDREREVAVALARGMSNAEIGAEPHIVVTIDALHIPGQTPTRGSRWRRWGILPPL